MNIRDALFHLLADSLQYVVLETDPGLVIRYASPSVQAVLGFTPDSLTGENLLNLVDPADRQGLSILTSSGEEQPAKRVVPFEVRARHANGRRRWVELSGANFVDEAEKTGLVITLRDITAAKKREIEAAESLDRHRTAGGYSEIGQAVVAGDTCLRANSTLLRIFGFALSEEIAGKPITGIVASRDRQALREVILAGRKEELQGRWRSFTGLRADGAEIAVELTALRTTHRRNPATLLLIKDSTERKEREDKLRKSETMLRLVFSASPVGIIVLGERSTITGINHRIYSITGYTPADLIGRTTDILYESNDECDRVEDYLFDEVRKCGMGAVDAKWVRKDGEIRSVSVNAAAVDPNDLSAGIVLTATDITARKEAEDRLSESEERYRIAIEQSNDGVALIEDGKTIYANRKCVAIFGYDKPEDLTGKSVFLTVHPDDLETIKQYYDLRNRREDAPARYEFRGVRKDGTVVDIETSIAMITFRGKRVALAYLRDVTGRKRIEEELKHTVATLRSILAVTPIGIGLLGPDRVINWANDSFFAIAGYSREDLAGKSVRMLYPTEQEFLNVGEVFYGSIYQRKVGSCETKWKRKDGSMRDVLLRGAATGADTSAGIVCAVIDVTDRNVMEEGIRRSEATLRSVIAACPIGIAFSTAEATISLINESMASTVGYSPAELTGKNMRIFYPAEEEFVRVSGIIGDAVKNGRIAAIETKWIHRDGRLRDILAHAVARDPNDLSAGLVFSCMDITERNEIYAAIRESEEKYRDIFERAVEGIYQHTPEGRYLSANPALARMLGFDSSEELLDSINNKSFQPIASAGDRGRYEIAMMSLGCIEAFEVQCRIKDGGLIWCSFNGRRVVAGPTNSVYYEGTVEDITPRKTAELALRESEKRYRSLYEFANDAIFLIRDGIFVDCNWRTVEMFGCTREDLIGHSVHAFSPAVQPTGGSSRKMIAAKVMAARSGEPQFFEWQHLRKNGTPFYAEVSLSMLEMNNEWFTLSIERDITDRKHSQEMLGTALAELETRNMELNEANREIRESQKKIIQQEKMASIGQLAAGVAHEINNPMGYIISNLASLDKYVKRISEFIAVQDGVLAGLEGQRVDGGGGLFIPSKEARRSLKIDFTLEDSVSLIRESQDGADRVKKIVQDLKGFSRVDESGFAVHDINKILDSTLNIVWNELKYKVVVKKEYGDVPGVACNAGQLSQVFMNLLVNASQAIPESGEITIRTWHEGESVFVGVKDTGVGIPKEALHRIFEPFFTTKEVGKGTGLGLSVVYDIVKSHKGDIEVKSEVGEGTEFTVRIPIENG